MVPTLLSEALNTRLRQISEYSEKAWPIQWIAERFVSNVARSNGAVDSCVAIGLFSLDTVHYLDKRQAQKLCFALSHSSYERRRFLLRGVRQIAEHQQIRGGM